MEPNTLDPFARGYTRRLAWRLIAERVYAPQDLDDIMQDLTLALLECRDRFDPAKSRWTYFVKTVLDRRAVSLRRWRLAQSRGAAQVVTSLSLLVADAEGQGVELARQISETEACSRRMTEHRDPLEQVRLSLSLQDARATLSPELVEICNLLAQRSVAEAARELKVPRTTLISRLKDVRRQFAKAGLDPCS